MGTTVKVIGKGLIPLKFFGESECEENHGSKRTVEQIKEELAQKFKEINDLNRELQTVCLHPDIKDVECGDWEQSTIPKCKICGKVFHNYDEYRASMGKVTE